MCYSKLKYETLTARIEAAHEGYFTDICIDSENCGVMDDNSEEFWAAMVVCLHDSAGQRLVEAGIDPATLGVSY